MGDKVRARDAMDERRGARPARDGVHRDRRPELEEAAERIGFPVIIKASAGGGGRGMKIVEDKSAWSPTRGTARSEAQAGFGNPDMSTSSATSSARATSRCRSSATATATTRTWASASVRSSGATRSSSRRRPRRRSTTTRGPRLCGAARQSHRSHRLQDRRHAGVPARRGRAVLLHGDEHAHPGRAHGDRDGVPASTWCASRSLSPPAIRCASRRAASRAATPSSCASTPRIRRPSRPRRARSPALNIPGGLGVRVDTHIYEGYVVPPHYDSLLAKLIVHDDRPRPPPCAARSAAWTSSSSRASRPTLPSTSASSTTRLPGGQSGYRLRGAACSRAASR